MKVRLLKMVVKDAHDRAHINSISWSCNAFRVTDWSASVGYRTDEDYKSYKDILSYGMNEKTFDRLVRQRYWELNKDKYYQKYKKSI